jgi:hypothetical protein
MLVVFNAVFLAEMSGPDLQQALAQAHSVGDVESVHAIFSALMQGILIRGVCV